MKERGSRTGKKGAVASGPWAVGLDAAGKLQQLAADTPQSCARSRRGWGIDAAAATDGCLRGASGR